MGRFLTGWVLAAGLLTLALPAFALVDEGKVVAAKQAADELLRRAEGSAASGVMPRRTDPAVASLLDAVFDSSALGADPIPMAKIAPVGELAMNGNRVGLAYILAGTGRADPSGADKEVLERVDRNTVTFAPEVGQFTDFQLAVTDRMARSALDFIGSAAPAALSQPRVQSGLGQMRAGFAQTIGGVIKTFSISGLDDDWKLHRLDALDRLADTASRFLGEGEKAGVRQLAGEVGGGLSPGVRTRVETFVQRAAAPAH